MSADSKTKPKLPPQVHALVQQAMERQQEAEALINAVVDAKFLLSKLPRSEAYKSGVKAWLMYRAFRWAMNPPQEWGTPEADAWMAGVEEGKAMWRYQVASMLPNQG